MLDHVTPEERTCPNCGESVLVSFDVKRINGLFSRGYRYQVVLSKPNDFEDNES